MSKNELVEYGSTAKNGKSEIGQIMRDDLKWNIGSNYLGRREYLTMRYNIDYL